MMLEEEMWLKCKKDANIEEQILQSGAEHSDFNPSSQRTAVEQQYFQFCAMACEVMCILKQRCNFSSTVSHLFQTITIPKAFYGS